jgi:hypothetical protein
MAINTRRRFEIKILVTSGPSVLEVSFELHAISFDLYCVHVALLQYQKHIPGLALDIFNTNTSYPKLKNHSSR